MCSPKIADLDQKVDRVNSLHYGKEEVFSEDKKIHIVFSSTKDGYKYDSKAIMSGFMSRQTKIHVDIFVNERKWGFMSFNDLHSAKCWTLSKLPSLACYL